MIPLREDNTSNMTIDKFLETLTGIYHDYFHKSYIYTNKRFVVLEPAEGQETSWYCRLTVEPYLQNCEEYFYCDPFNTGTNRIYITFDIPTAEVTEDEPKMMPKDGIAVRSTTHFDICGKNGEIIKSLPIGRSFEDIGTPEDMFDWFETLTRKLYKAVSRGVSNNEFDEEFIEDFEGYL